MNTPVLHLTDGALHIDNSSLERGTTCPRSFLYNFALKRQKAGPRPALDFGRIIHKALEVRYRNASHRPLAQIEATQLQILGQEFETYIPPEDDYRTYQLACEAIMAYNARYPVEDFEPAFDPQGQPLVETSFAVPLGFVVLDLKDGQSLTIQNNTQEPEVVSGPCQLTIPVVWTGRIDLAYRREGRLYLMDHKTTSMMGPTFYQDFDLSHATHGYCFALERITGTPVSGYVINALGIRKPTRTGKGLEFERKSVFVQPELLEEWQQDTLEIVRTLLSYFVEGYFPKHTKWCVGKYGACEYFDVCTMPPASRDIILSSGNYKDVTWTPHASD